MSANINENSRVFTVGTAWHGLGQVVESAVTALEAIKLAKLDYGVKMVDLFQGESLSGLLKVPDAKAIIREDTRNVLGITTQKYKIVQNTDAFSFFDVVVGEGQAIYHSAGALGLGEKIWMMAKLPNDIVINSEDKVEKYLLLSNSHDGKSSLRMYFTPVRVVCQNTLNLSMADAKNGISIRHTGNIKTKIDEARRVLGISINYYDQFEKITKQMEEKVLTYNEVESYFNNVLNVKDEQDVSTRKSNQKDELISLFHHGKGQKLGNKESLWKAYNAVTEYVDHYRTVKNIDEDATNKLNSIWFGSGAKLKDKAYNEAVLMLN